MNLPCIFVYHINLTVMNLTVRAANVIVNVVRYHYIGIRQKRGNTLFRSMINIKYC